MDSNNNKLENFDNSPHEYALEQIDFLLEEVRKLRGSMRNLFSEVYPLNKIVSVGSGATPFREHVISCITSATEHLTTLKSYDPQQPQNQQNPRRVILRSVLSNEEKLIPDRDRIKIEKILKNVAKKRERNYYAEEDEEDLDENSPSTVLNEIARKQQKILSSSSKIRKLVENDESSYSDPIELLKEMKKKVKDYFAVVDVLYHDKQMTSTHSVLALKIYDLFTCLIVLKGVVPLNITIYGMDEDINNRESCSKYHIFRKMSNSCCKAIEYYNQHSNYKTYPFQALMIYICSFRRVFNDKCNECGNMLIPPLVLEPPAFRDFETLKPYHTCHIPIQRRKEIETLNLISSLFVTDNNNTLNNNTNENNNAMEQ
ncbi:hypothetical protein ABK040_001814 [Willaertia magna]